MSRAWSRLIVLSCVEISTFGAALSVNGTCHVGNCGSPDVAASETSSSTAFNFVVTLPNTDQYRIVGSINAGNTNSTVDIVSPFTVTYLGNTAGTSSGADVLNLDVLQNYQLSFPLNHSTETAQGGFGGAIAAGSSAQIQLVINGQALPVLGPFPAPASFSFKSPSYSLSGIVNPVGFDVKHTFTFATGSGVGATIFNALTPTSTLGDGSTSLEACDSSSSGGSTCQVIACDGVGSSLPIYRLGPKPLDTAAPAYTCSVAMIDTETGSGSILPILVFDGSGGTLPLFVFDGAGSSLPILVFEGGGSSLPVLASDGSGGTLPILVIADSSGSGGTLPIFRSPGASAHAAALSPGTAIEIATPLQSAAATYTAVAACPPGTATCWLTIPVAGGTIAVSTRAAITTLVNVQGLLPGVYTANVTISIAPNAAKTPTVLNVPVTVMIPSAGPALTLSQTGLQFQAIAGATSLPAQSISVLTSGPGSLPFTATALTLSGSWLTVLSPASGTATPTTPAQVSIQANPAGLAAGTYFGRVEFASSGAINRSQSVEVVLTVSSTGATTSVVPAFSTSALMFVAGPTATNPPAQAVQLSNPSSQTLTVSTSLSYANGSGWLTASSAGSTVTSAQPLTETIAVNAAGLKSGVYVGSVVMHIAEANADHLVEVLLVVKASSCTPTQLLPVVTNLEGGFQRTAGLPVPLLAQVVDNCGSPLTSGSVVAYFTGGDASVSLKPLGPSAPGQWSGTWFPHSVASGGPTSVGIMATSFTPALYGSAGVAGAVGANPAVPVVSLGGIVSAASVTNTPLAGGGLISIYGSNLATGLSQANSVPYPNTLGGTRVLLGGVPIPLQVVTQSQINAAVPYDTPIGVPQQLVVQQNATYTPPETVVAAAALPAVFTLNQSGRGAGVIVVVKPDGTQFVNGPSQPASVGDALVIYCTGLGGVTPAVPTGSAAPLAPLSYAAAPITVTIGGQSATPFFAGLTPGFVGLYQVNAYVPAGVAPGPNVAVVLSTTGSASVPVTVAIR